MTEYRFLSLRAAALAFAGSLAACTVGPDYQVPPMRLAALHNAAAVNARTAPAAPSLDVWWTGFDDPVLTGIIERALQQNLDLAQALARVEQARAAARAARARELPSADLSAQATALRQSVDSPLGLIARHGPGYNRDQRLYDAETGASWEIDLFGGLRRDSEAAVAEAQAAEADHDGIRISVVADAADAYAQIRGDQARLALAADQVATDERLLALVRYRALKGVATDREVAQADALAAQARAVLPPLRTALEAQFNRLDVLMGAQPGTYAAELASPAAIPTVPAIRAERSAAGLLRRRPDIIAAERRLAAANARIGAEVAQYYPSVSLNSLLGFESLGAGSMFQAAAFQPQATAGLRWRLFDFGRIDADVARATAATAEALAGYRLTLLRAAENVENAFMTLVQTEAEECDLAREVDALQRARDTSELAYKGGLIGLTDVLDADRQLLLARDDLARSKADDMRAAVAAYRALGGGW